MTTRYEVRPALRVEGDVRVPGDKSISHRALIIASMAAGRCAIEGLSTAEDVASTARALARLGVRLAVPDSQVEPDVETDRGSSSQIMVDSEGLEGLRAPPTPLDCGNSGTTIRLMMGMLAGRPLSVVLDGDASLRRRPMERIAHPLRLMGAHVDTSSGTPPVTVRGGSLTGIEYELPMASAQVKTAVLLAGVQARGSTTVRERLRSRDHTERMLKHFGIQVDESINRVSVKEGNLQSPVSLEVPGDMSSAAFLLVAAAIVPGSSVTVREVGVNPTRTGILDVLRRFGALVEISDEVERSGEPRATVRVAPADRRPVRVEATEVPGLVDELPLVAVLGAYAEGETVVSGAEELRVKESDRIEAVAAGLAALGADVRTAPDGFTIRGGWRLSGGTARSAGDHRIAMALAVAALGASGPSTIEGWDAVAVSYPEFGATLDAVVVPDGRSR